ncbi:MAG: furin-like repeat-containing protein, partial [Mycobacterium sp.]
MTATPRRFAAATLAAFMPLAAVAVATAAPSAAESCSRGQVSYNGNCVDKCNESQVRNADSGECQSLLSAAVQKAQTPAVAKLTPESLGGVYELARSVNALPEINNTIGTTFGIVNTVVSWPAVLAAAGADTAATLAFLGLVPGAALGGGNVLQGIQSTGETFALASNLAGAATTLPPLALPAPPQMGLGLPGLPPPPSFGLPG